MGAFNIKTTTNQNVCLVRAVHGENILRVLSHLRFIRSELFSLRNWQKFDQKVGQIANMNAPA